MPTRTLLVARWTDVAVAAAVLIARRIEFGGRDGTGGGSRDRSIVASGSWVEHPEVVRAVIFHPPRTPDRESCRTKSVSARRSSSPG
jgi:hypothetical protein